MSIEKLKRVMWRIMELNRDPLLMTHLRKAIMFECGTDERTITHCISKLSELGWIKRKSRHSWYVTNQGEFDGTI